jgi:uncharacterized lipoprotein YddW (UPF0748 family)
MRQLSVLCVYWFFVLIAHAQPKNFGFADKTSPKREFRGIWMASVENIDWPSSPGLSVTQQKKELTDMLNAHQKAGINAIMLQIRPAADALYLKSREPWSKWLTGRQGIAPSPAYDPLEFAIEEAHKRGMELHAWFNPYRASTNNKFAELSPTHITKTKPKWFFTYGGIKLFNPGLPEVRDYIVSVFLDVVDNYDIDGVHLDDYFYPYQIKGQHINDLLTYKKYGAGFNDLKDWRRNNVDLLIKALSDSIHKHKPYIKFGISPFGVWANKYQNPEGSETTGGSSYYELFADSRKWVKEGWIDYINPQIYWPIDDVNCPFNKLMDWWSENKFDRQLYIGMAAYRINERKNIKFKDAAQMPNQIKYLRNNQNVAGSVYFSSRSLLNNPLGFTDSLKETYYKNPALPPTMRWRDSIPPNPPTKLVASIIQGGVLLNWETPALAIDNETAYGYVVYRFNHDEMIDLNNPKYILHIQYNNSTNYQDKTAEVGKNYIYIVTALDRIKNESLPSPGIEVSLQ